MLFVINLLSWATSICTLTAFLPSRRRSFWLWWNLMAFINMWWVQRITRATRLTLCLQGPMMALSHAHLSLVGSVTIMLWSVGWRSVNHFSQRSGCSTASWNLQIVMLLKKIFWLCPCWPLRNISGWSGRTVQRRACGSAGQTRASEDEVYRLKTVCAIDKWGNSIV